MSFVIQKYHTYNNKHPNQTEYFLKTAYVLMHKNSSSNVLNETIHVWFMVQIL